MATTNETQFSEFECDLLSMKIGETAYDVKCIGNIEQETEVRKVTKKCCGVVAKSRTYGTGNGTLKLTAHMPYKCYVELHAMDGADLKDGIYGYGRGSLHPVVPITGHITNEDGDEKYKAWPCCTVSTGPADKIENGAEEVAEVELEIAFTPDVNGYGVYEALADDLDKATKEAWMKEFTPALMQVATV